MNSICGILILVLESNDLMQSIYISLTLLWLSESQISVGLLYKYSPSLSLLPVRKFSGLACTFQIRKGDATLVKLRKILGHVYISMSMSLAPLLLEVQILKTTNWCFFKIPGHFIGFGIRRKRKFKNQKRSNIEVHGHPEKHLLSKKVKTRDN